MASSDQTHPRLFVQFFRLVRSLVKQRLLYLGYEAWLHRDRYSGSHIIHYTITRAGDPHILAWGQEWGEEAAEQAAEECIRDLQSRRLSTVA